MNFKWVAKEVEHVRRRTNLSWGHHREIAPLEPPEQKRWLDIAEKEELSVHHLRNKIKKEKKNEMKKKITGLPEGKYRIIYADPPWEYNDSGLDDTVSRVFLAFQCFVGSSN